MCDQLRRGADHARSENVHGCSNHRWHRPGPIEAGVVLVRDGEIETVGAIDAVEVPADAERIDATGKTFIPGLINTHGHVNPSPYTEESVLGQLGLYARCGVTTVVSLGGDQEVGIQLRDRQETRQN